MYLKQLHLKNIACFSNTTLDFTREGEPCPWVILLGKNGTGKSTILQMLALALLGRDLVHQVASDVDWPRFVRNGPDKKGRVDITLIPTPQDKKAGTKKQYQARFEMGHTATTGKTGLRQDDKFGPSDYEKLDDTLYSYNPDIGHWFSWVGFAQSKRKCLEIIVCRAILGRKLSEFFANYLLSHSTEPVPNRSCNCLIRSSVNLAVKSSRARLTSTARCILPESCLLLACLSIALCNFRLASS